MEDNLLCPADALKSAVDLFLAALGEHLQADILGPLFIDQPADEIVFNLTGRREADFNFLKSELQEEVVEFDLFIHSHGVNQCLIPVAEIDTAPDWGFLDLF